MESNGTDDQKILEELLDEKERRLQELEKELKSERKRRRSYKKECKQLKVVKNGRKGREVGCQTDLIARTTCCICQISIFSKNTDTQTFETDFCPVESANSALDWQVADGSNITITDMVKETAEAAMKSDYIYDETSQMYYSITTGYYYDPKSELFYEPHSRVYYSYDAETQQYSFHSQLVDDHVVTNRNGREGRKKTNRSHKRKPPKSKASKHSKNKTPSGDKDSDLEEGEVRDSGEGSVESDVSDTATAYPPSARMIVECSETLQEGSLLLVTYMGATIGRDDNLDLCIPDTNVSRIHAKIVYDELNDTYLVRDLGSQNGTFVNDYRLSESKDPSEGGHVIIHGDRVTFGGCTLLVHIHDGHNTCNGCEPGLLQSVSQSTSRSVSILSKQEREEERKQQLRQMKKRYGLQSSDYESDKQSDIQKHGYKDRADHRRKTKGSINPYEKDAEPASVDRPVPIDNKGYKMLKKMGWDTGKGLGQSQPGILEPINVNTQFNRAGLGARTTEDNPVV